MVRLSYLTNARLIATAMGLLLASCSNNFNIQKVSPTHAEEKVDATTTPTIISQTTLEKPKILSIEQTDVGEIVMSWESSGRTTFYNIYRDVTETATNSAVIATSTTPAFTDKDAKYGTQYYYRVGYVAAGSEFLRSESKSILTAAPPVSNVSLVVNDHDITLSWPAQRDAVSYKVRRATGTGSSLSLAEMGTATTGLFVDTTIHAATTYTYDVIASYASKDSASSAAVSGVTRKLSITNLAAAPANTAATLTWLGHPDAVGYGIYRTTIAGSYGTSALTTVATSSFHDTGLINGLSYYYKVVANYGTGAALASSEVSAQPFGLPGPAWQLSAETAQDQRVTLRWTIPTRGGPVTSFKIFRGTSAGVSTSGTPLTTTTATQMSYVDSGLTNGTTYYYSLVPSNSQGDGPAANEAWAKPWVDTMPASADNIFVNVNATIGGDGSLAAPYQTISSGFAAVNAGGTVNIMDGIYNITTGITVNKAVEIRSLTGSYLNSNAIVRGNATNIAAFSTTTPSMIIKGLHFTNFLGGVNQGVVRAGNTSDNLKVIANHFYTNQGPGITTANVTVVSGIIIERNLIENLTGATISGLYLGNVSNCSVNFNDISNTTYAGIQLQAGVNCTIKGNRLSTLISHGINLTLASGNVTISDNIIDNVNTAHGADHGGIRTYATALVGPVTIEGNKVTNTFNAFSLRNGEDLTGKTIIIRNNHFANSIANAAYHGGIGSLDVSQNYWGSALGPYHLTFNPIGVMSAFLDDTKLFVVLPFLTYSPFY